MQRWWIADPVRSCLRKPVARAKTTASPKTRSPGRTCLPAAAAAVSSRVKPLGIRLIARQPRAHVGSRPRCITAHGGDRAVRALIG
nr:hypothetical protein CFP56_08075 [Quercus suber]